MWQWKTGGLGRMMGAASMAKRTQENKELRRWEMSRYVSSGGIMMEDAVKFTSTNLLTPLRFVSPKP